MKRSDVVLSNQYLIVPTLDFRQTDYLVDDPHRCAEQWRDQGWSAVEYRGGVRVFHGPEAPLPLDQATASERLPRTANEATRKAVNGTLTRALVKAGYQRREIHKYTSFQSLDGYLYPSAHKDVKVSRCRTWTWDIDFQGEECWLTPKPTWTKVTDVTAAYFAASSRGLDTQRRWTMVNVRTGKTWTNQALSDHADAEWAHDPYVRVIIGPRTDADDTLPSLNEIHQAVQAEPAFSGIANTQRSRELDAQSWQEISGQRLKIGRTRITERREIRKFGVHQRPLNPVTLAFVIPSHNSAARDALLYRFGSPGAIEAAGFERPATNVPHVWNIQWKLQSGSGLTWEPSPFTYSADTGQLVCVERLKRAKRQAQEKGETLVTVTVLPRKNMSSEAKAALHTAVKPFNPVLALEEIYVSKKPPESVSTCRSIVARLALKILRAGGGLPYQLDILPGTDSGTYYLGLDVGSNHSGGWSNVAMVLVDCHGRVVADRVERFQENNERIPTELLRHTLPGWLKELSEMEEDRMRRIKAPSVQHLIVHRDGKFVDREAEELQDALSHLQKLDLIEVKKNSALRIETNTGTPTLCRLGERTAVIFNRADPELRIKPIEVHAVSDSDVVQAAVQVFWLSEMRTDELYRPGRLPVTTLQADRKATTAP